MKIRFAEGDAILGKSVHDSWTAAEKRNSGTMKDLFYKVKDVSTLHEVRHTTDQQGNTKTFSTV